MTIRLTRSQATCMALIRRGVNTSPPLIHMIVRTLIANGYVAETVVKGQVFYYLTDKGKDFG